MIYGTVEKETVKDNTTIKTEERIRKQKIVFTRTTYIESVMIEKPGQLLTDFLKLMDKQKKGEIGNYAINVYQNEAGIAFRYEKTWQTTNLQ